VFWLALILTFAPGEKESRWRAAWKFSLLCGNHRQADCVSSTRPICKTSEYGFTFSFGEKAGMREDIQTNRCRLWRVRRAAESTRAARKAGQINQI
jgi:hypothetical protein